MKGVPKEYLDQQSVTILADIFYGEELRWILKVSLLQIQHCFLAVSQEFRDIIIFNFDAFILSKQRFYSFQHLSLKMKTLKSLKAFLIWVITQFKVDNVDIEINIFLIWI